MSQGKSEALVVAGLWRPRSDGRVVASGDLDLEKLKGAVNALGQGGRKLRFVLLDNSRAQAENERRPDLLLMVAPDRPPEERGQRGTGSGRAAPSPPRSPAPPARGAGAPARTIRPPLGASREF